MITKYFLLTLILVNSLACTSALKKQCETTNWFQHAQNLALSGKRINQDDFIKLCEKEEVEINAVELDQGFKSGMSKYCTADGALSTGKSGLTLTEDFCSSSELVIVRKKHAEGIAFYCTKENLFEIGVNGKIYTGICSKELEKTNLIEYKKGRKKYLVFQIQQTKEKVQRLQNEKTDLNRKYSQTQWSLQNLRPSYVQFNPMTMKTETIDPDDTARNTLNSQLINLDYKIRQTEKEIKLNQEDIDKMSFEANTLPDSMT